MGKSGFQTSPHTPNPEPHPRDPNFRGSFGSTPSIDWPGLPVNKIIGAAFKVNGMRLACLGSPSILLRSSGADKCHSTCAWPKSKSSSDIVGSGLLWLADYGSWPLCMRKVLIKGSTGHGVCCSRLCRGPCSFAQEIC